MVSIAATLVSNSTQLDNVDLMSGPRDFTITGATLNDSDQPLSINLAEYDRPWKPGVTVRRILTELWGDETDAWIGRRVRLFRDEKVTFGRDKTGGTRISHASHISKTMVVTLPISKGKFGEFKVEPLVEQPPPPAAPVDPSKAIEWFAAKNVPVSSLEAHVSKPVAEWTAGDLGQLERDRDAIVGGGGA